MPRHASLSDFLRRALLALLILGASLQPAFAAVCDLGNERAFAFQGADTTTSADGDHADAAGDCCANPSCSDCCLHATAFPSQAAPAIASVMPTMQPVPLATGFRSSDYPVDIRPPIAN